MRIRFIPEAEADVKDAYGWYKERGLGLADEFRSSVDACLVAIARHPNSFPIIHKDLRRALLRRFPYGIYYLVEGEAVVVFGCMHAARDPKAWQRRGI